MNLTNYSEEDQCNWSYSQSYSLHIKVSANKEAEHSYLKLTNQKLSESVTDLSDAQGDSIYIYISFPVFKIFDFVS